MGCSCGVYGCTIHEPDTIATLRAKLAEVQLEHQHIASALGLSEWDPHDILNAIIRLRYEKGGA